MSSISFDEVCKSSEDFDARNEKYQPAIYRNLPQHFTPFDQLEQLTLQPLAHRVTQIGSSGVYADYGVDGCIRVRTPSDLFRQYQIQHWTAAKAHAITNSWKGGVFLLFSAVGAVVNPACIIAAIASAIFMGIHIHRTSQASKQIELWNHSPAHWVAEQRSLAYKNGFSHAYEHRLKIEAEPSKTGVLHQIEVEHLYHKYFPDYCLKLLNSNPNTHQTWMLSFLHNNPLSANLITYAKGQIPPTIQPVSNDFAQLQSILKNIQNDFSRIRDEVRANANQTIEAYNIKRTASLLPLQLARDHYIATAQAELNEKLKKLSGNARKNALNTFYAERDKYELFYTLAATPINLYFDNQIQQTRIQCDNTLKNLRSNESQNLATYYPAARDLIDRAYRTWTQPYTYQPMNFAQYGYPVPQASAPSFDNLPNFQQQMYQQPTQGWTPAQQAAYQQFVQGYR